MNLFIFLVNAIYWLWLFFVPTIILGLVSIWLFYESESNFPYSLAIGIIGLVIGILLAEYVRRKHGLDLFFGRILSTPDLDNLESKKTLEDK